MAKKGTKKRDGVQSGCFANLNLSPFCCSRCRRRRRLPKLPTDRLWSQSWTIRAFLHGGGGPSVGGVTRLSIQSLILMWSRLHVRWGNPPHVTSPTWGPPPSCKQALNRFHSRGQHLCKFYWNKRNRLHKKRVQLPQNWFGTPIWPPFHCFGTPIWSPWRHVAVCDWCVTSPTLGWKVLIRLVGF